MRPIGKEEILGFEQWEKVRRVLRPAILREKERRRLAVGSHLTFLFENTQTLWYQIEEMLRIERLSDPQAVQHEIDTYNELIPAPGELSATMLVEFPEAKERDAALRRLIGLERHIVLKVGNRKAPAKFDERQMAPDRISSVQFIRFDLTGMDPDEFLKLAQDGQAAIEVDHPNLAAHGPITGALASALAGDLGPEPPQA